MQSHISVSAILVATLLGSTVTVVAQTGELVAAVPGVDVHRGYALQDALQNARNRTTASQPVATQQRSTPRHTELPAATK
jgi:hypothetical protein